MDIKDPRILFGLIIITVLATLCVIIALGKVEEHTSYGLMPLVVSFSSLAAQWSQWAFSTKEKKEKEKDKESDVLDDNKKKEDKGE
jgi:hypothetical protein